MRSRFVLFALIWLMTALAGAQAPRDRPRPVNSKVGRITGAVVSAGAEPKPLRRARVTLNGSLLQPGRTAITSDAGTFAFDGVPPGQYSIAATKSGYITLEHGATGPGRPGLPVTLAPGGHRTVTIAIPKGGAITGTVTDADGQPVSGLQVQALTYRITPPTGERRLTPARHPPVVTDDRGIYRIFGLPAAEYGIAVRPRSGPEPQMAGFITTSSAEIKQALAEVRQPRGRGIPPRPPLRPPVPPEPGRNVGLAPVFYPGTTHAAQARLVILTGGEEKTSIDIQIDYVPVSRVAGTVIPGAGGATRAYVWLVPDPQDALVDAAAYRVTVAEADGLFAFDRVTPGRYILIARASEYPMQVRSDASSSLWATTEIAVEGSDITNAVLTPIAGVTIAGRLLFQRHGAAPNLTRFQAIGLPLSPAIPLGGRPVAQVAVDGRFFVPNVLPGTFWPESASGLRSPIGAWWLKSITVDGREALDAPLTFRTSTNDVVVTFADTAAELTGRVVDTAGEPATNCLVVVFPANNAFWFFNSRRIAAVPPDAQGRYAIRNLPAGDYLVVVRDDLDALQWFDPETLQQLVPAAARIKIDDNQPLTYDITVPGR